MTEEKETILPKETQALISALNSIQGNKKPTIQVFYSLIDAYFGANKQNDNRIALRFNEMSFRYEIFNTAANHWQDYTDADTARIRALFQTKTGYYQKDMLQDALSIWFDKHRVNPLTEMLNGLSWDGNPRIENFLTNVMGANDTPYVRECSRLIFAGGIHRAFDPGCKFDDMVVLIGNQGNGKSTIIRWLNMNDRYFGELTTIHGKEAIEATQGLWIIEVAELMAMNGFKEVEAVKRYITSTKDQYRQPYGKSPVVLPRRCCFIGTTNNHQFLTDHTGNRRFYPVECNISPFELYDHEKEVKAYIVQAWAEAVRRYRNNALPPYADRSIMPTIKEAQADAMIDDWRVGMIDAYLSKNKNHIGDKVCIPELWFDALKHDFKTQPARKDSNELAQILTNFPNWKRTGVAEYTQRWGKQRTFIRIF